MDDGIDDGQGSDGAGGRGAGGDDRRLLRRAGRVVVAKSVYDADRIRRAAEHAIVVTQDSMAQLTYLAANYPTVRVALRKNLRGLSQIKLAVELLLSSLDSPDEAVDDT